MPRRMTATALICLGLLAGCSETPPTGVDDAPVSSVPEPLSAQTTDAASDGGQLEFTESAVTAFKDDHGRDAYTWAVGVRNTSTSNLLVYALYDRTLIDTEGESHSYPETQVYTVLPGQTMYQGNITSTDFVPAEIAPTVTSAAWVPMAALAEQGADAGVELSEGTLGHGTDKLIARVSFVSRGIGVRDQMVGVLVLFRDAEAELLGAVLVGETMTSAPGAVDLERSFETSHWLPKADESTSTATISVSCCGI